mgnify:CR=1 FL=1
MEIGAFEEIQKYFTDKNSIEFMVKYQMKTNANGQEFSGTMTQYFKGADRIRMDSETMGVESRVFMEETKYTMCSKQNNEWTCFEIDGDEATSESDSVRNDVEKNIKEWNIKKIASRTIAGATATCYKTSKDDNSVEYCFSKEGVPLYIKTEGKESGVTFMSELTATYYSLSVSESVFEKPASSQSMEDYLANIPGYS